MTAYIIRRILWQIPVLVIVGLLTFGIAKMTPGGPFDTDPTRRQMSPQVEAVLRDRFGMDLPFWRQFTRYMFLDVVTDPKTGEQAIRWGAIGGNFGPTYSSRGARTVQQELFGDRGGKPSRFYYSARLGVQALLFAVLLGIPMGVLAALKQNTWIDYLVLLTSTFFVSLSTLIVGFLLVLIFASWLKWFTVLPNWNDPIRPWILPTIALGSTSLGFITRLTRSSVLEVKRQDYVRTAQAKGLNDQVVVWRHMLKNAVLPVITILGPLSAALITGTLYTEIIFQVPGMGSLLIEAIGKRDYSMIMAGALVFVFFLGLANLIVDIAYGVVDPRISYK
ncbi:ABC transporter permease [Candidatus Chloroploca sp. M-50]|uniref:ABC transporter permease n=1 Tax=Candidatus Chloroploca mongolica TaxID=2528176 RepID=A0ABS4D8A4_9CHLR|nr:ABC transporter permease [Candidatus Chloroploca mongolica]MBP1465681.1 ABC transporter permease [Candidatus Chloroploca mongolica]